MVLSSCAMGNYSIFTIFPITMRAREWFGFFFKSVPDVNKQYCESLLLKPIICFDHLEGIVRADYERKELVLLV